MDSLHDIHGLVKLPEYEVLKKMAIDIEAVVTGRPTGNTNPTAQEESEDEDYIQHLKSLKVE